MRNDWDFSSGEQFELYGDDLDELDEDDTVGHVENGNKWTNGAWDQTRNASDIGLMLGEMDQAPQMIEEGNLDITIEPIES